MLAAFAAVFTLSYITFAVLKATIGIRVSEEQEDAGLDIAEHGMYGYPEQFIPAAEIGAASTGPASAAGATTAGVTASSARTPGEVPA